MAFRRVPFVQGEWYHLFSRGIDQRTIFENSGDFKRFLKLLYLGNDHKEVNLELLKNIPYTEIFSLPRNKPLVAVGGYCLMGNHPHLLVQEKTDGGITKFMHKIGTAYTSYFNKKYDRIGNLMVKPFRSKHISDDRYLKRVAQYIHLNPAEVFEKDWKKGILQSPSALEKNLLTYPYSSLQDYFGREIRPERSILDDDAFQFFRNDIPSLAEVLKETRLYYQEIEGSFLPKPRGRPKLN